MKVIPLIYSPYDEKMFLDYPEISDDTPMEKFWHEVLETFAQDINKHLKQGTIPQYIIGSIGDVSFCKYLVNLSERTKETT